jgi:hypothetical protein
MHIAINGWFFGQTTTGSGQYLHHLLAQLPQQAAHVHLSVLIPASSAATAAMHARINPR